MSSPEAQPAKRRPGRPRKSPDPEVVEDAVPELEETPVVQPSDPDDGRIGQKVDDPNWTAVVFMDDTQYRVEDGVIVERVR